MRSVVLLCQVVALVLCDGPPAPPRDIHVDNWVLMWTPASEERDVTHTVQYSKFNIKKWLNVTSCVHTSLNSCNVSFTKREAEYGCVKLRVLAEREGLTSKPAEACSRQGDSCSPDLSLTARSGSLTVHLSRDHILAKENEDHAGHKVCFGKEGQRLQECKYSTSSLTITKLEEGQRYCVQVQYTYFTKPVGLPSCTKCVDIINTRVGNKQTGVIVGVVVFVAVLVLVPVIAYVLIFHRRRIKRYLQPPVHIPDDFLRPVRHIPLSPVSDEECDPISQIIPQSREETERSSAPRRPSGSAAAFELSESR